MARRSRRPRRAITRRAYWPSAPCFEACTASSLVPGYQTKQERIAIAGVDDLIIRSLLDRQQFSDPLGDAERQGISSAMWPLFGVLWPSAAHLAARLALRPLQGGERILEIGCGLALASLVGHRRGADVTASDCHPLTAAFLDANLRLNELAPMKYLHGDWVQRPIERADRVQGRYDLIIGSDLLYERDDRAVLSGFIGRHAEERCEVWIVDPGRGNRPAFNRQMAALGFRRDEEAIHALATATSDSYRGRIMVYRRA